MVYSFNYITLVSFLFKLHKFAEFFFFFSELESKEEESSEYAFKEAMVLDSLDVKERLRELWISWKNRQRFFFIFFVLVVAFVLTL